ncbi:MAG: type II secretion system F family protein [Anaerovoracaceae bacterium]
MKSESGKKRVTLPRSASIQSFRSYLTDPTNRKQVAGILIACLVLALLAAGKGLAGGKKFIVDEKGNVVGIYRNDPDSSASYPLKLKIRSRSGETERDVTLTLKGKQKSAKRTSDALSPEEKQEQAIDQMLTSLQGRSGRLVRLPKRLADGSRLSWSGDSKSDPAPFVILMVLLLIGSWQNEKRKVKEAASRRRESILKGLPSFNDQLLMLMQSGLIFKDAFYRIADGYRERRENDFFRQEIIRCREESERRHESVSAALDRCAQKTGVREFIRVSGIIRDSQIRGTDLSPKLKREGVLLWERRKKQAEEKGKAADVRLTMPLAILLVILILITAAPAVMQI